MDIRLVESTSAHMQAGQLLYMTCLSGPSIYYSISGCPCLAVCVREAHVSYMQRQADRYLILISSSQEKKLENIPTPCTIRVNNSADFVFDDIYADGGKEPCLATLIMDLTVEPSLPGPITPHQAPPSIVLPGMPHVGNDSICNCNTRGSSSMIVVQAPLDSSTQSPGQHNQDTATDDSNDLYKLHILVRGSTYNKSFQKALGLARQAGPQAFVHFVKEPENPVDKNALAIIVPDIEPPGQIGYVPGSWLRALYNELPNIHTATKSKITRGQHKEVGTYYMAEINILKCGRWMKKDCDYKYNDNLDG